MERGKVLRVNLDELCTAMEDNSYEHEYYLDMETGEILFISEYVDDEGAGKRKDLLVEDYTLLCHMGVIVRELFRQPDIVCFYLVLTTPY